MQKLNFLQQNWSHLPAQGTDEWLASRRTRIGGSEMASAIGMSPYQSADDLVVVKCAAKKLKAAPCTFGRILEPVAKLIIEEDYYFKIHELGAVPSTRYPVCYSPDGLAVCEDKLKLIEIKCPFRRSKLETIPPYYLCQVQTGMNVLPCEETLFFQFRFRLCPLAVLGNSKKYNRWLHTESYRRCAEETPSKWGWLHFEDECDMTDLGELHRDNADTLCIVDGLSAEIHMGTPDRVPDTGYVVPWKLFNHTCVRVPRDPMFLETHAETLWTLHSRLSEQKD